MRLRVDPTACRPGQITPGLNVVKLIGQMGNDVFQVAPRHYPDRFKFFFGRGFLEQPIIKDLDLVKDTMPDVVCCFRANLLRLFACDRFRFFHLHVPFLS